MLILSLKMSRRRGVPDSLLAGGGFCRVVLVKVRTMILTCTNMVTELQIPPLSYVDYRVWPSQTIKGRFPRYYSFYQPRYVGMTASFSSTRKRANALQHPLGHLHPLNLRL